MTIHFPTRLSWKFLLAIAMLVPAVRASAAEPSNSNDAGAASATNASTGIDFFAAIRNGDLDVKFIPRDSRRAQVLIKNNTDQPLSVKLPDAFVGMPVLAQAAGGAGNGNGNRSTTSNNNKSQNQSVGGGMGGGQVGGAFSVPPERVVKIQVAVVCLNYGKPDPSPHVPYTIVPADTYTSDPELRQVIRMLGEGQMDQRTAQIAAWHLANHMSWDELAELKVFPHFPQYTRPYFSVDEIHEAMGIVAQAIKQADARQEPSSATSSASASSASSATSSAGSANLLPVKN